MWKPWERGGALEEKLLTGSGFSCIPCSAAGGRNSELSSLRLALDRGNDIMQSLLTVLLQRLGSSGGPGGAGAWGGSVSEEASCSRRASAVPGYRSAPATTSPAAEHCADADISFPILAEDTKLGSCVGATAPLPSEIEQLMMVGEASMLCGTQDECPNAQLLDMPPGGGGSDAVAAGKAFSVVLMDNQEPSASCMSVTENKSARGNRRGSVLEPKRVRKATARMNL
ncbi:uncharacterized protein LOC125436190 [Sphaerodactylus townsendi]|uniref:uncharacterized protein LOC125436190 n=1 Tax=Sphaerodactylus townsendi TaxID=933632 RepID=UPI002025DED0|nr:uncharacterized protein LOC125436190 [Sphaerodactylus townsendi]XP_048358902.1 uncharacterized protein LOC125436190 [Sphaerodactylus townsendi]